MEVVQRVSSLPTMPSLNGCQLKKGDCEKKKGCFSIAKKIKKQRQLLSHGECGAPRRLSACLCFITETFTVCQSGAPSPPLSVPAHYSPSVQRVNIPMLAGFAYLRQEIFLPSPLERMAICFGKKKQNKTTTKSMVFVLCTGGRMKTKCFKSYTTILCATNTPPAIVLSFVFGQTHPGSNMAAHSLQYIYPLGAKPFFLALIGPI